MQTLDVISVNIWNMLISLANLVILFLLVKKFLYKPVKAMIDSRQADIDSNISEAEKAKADAYESKRIYDEKLSLAETEADSIIKKASDAAHNLEDEIIKEAKQKADGIVTKAKEDGALELKKAESQIKDEIVNVGVALAEKILEREITQDDHKKMIDSFIENLESGEN